MSEDQITVFGAGLVVVAVVAIFFAFASACEELYDWHQKRMRHRR